jgi:hypothetical protein
MPLQIGMHAQTPFSPSGLVEVVGIEDIHPLMPRQTVLVRFLDPIPTATPLALWDATSAMNFGRSARMRKRAGQHVLAAFSTSRRERWDSWMSLSAPPPPKLHGRSRIFLGPLWRTPARPRRWPAHPGANPRAP